MQRLQNAITNRSIDEIANYFFTSDLALKDNVKFENELWDYKSNVPEIGKKHNIAWARIAKYVLSFYNLRGGVLIFGINNNYEIHKTTSNVDSKKFNDKLKKFIPDSIYVYFVNYNRDDNGKYIGIVIIPPRGSVLEKFKADAPCDEQGNFLFKAGWSAIRKGDQSIILDIKEFENYKNEKLSENNNKIFIIDEPMFKILNPEWKNFVHRNRYCDEIMRGINDKRTSIISITGIGGIGKTALATWAVLQAYEKKIFKFIVSVTAKDRELAQHGINAIFPTIATIESVLSAIFEVLGLEELKALTLNEQEKYALDLLEDSNGLLYIDNLETIEDHRVINFLDSLPVGVKAITTSRRTRVKFSVFPITVEKMSNTESLEYLKMLSKEDGLIYLSKLEASQATIIANNVDSIPLALKWCARRCSSISELTSLTQEIKDSGRASEELLEFSYRRIFDKMSTEEKTILYTLACFDRPVEVTVILFICKTHTNVEDSLETLSDDSLILKTYNNTHRFYEYSLMPLTRNFILTQFKNEPIGEKNIRSRISTYYEATDIKDPNEREAMKTVRGHGGDKLSVYINIAEISMKEGNFTGAENHLKCALEVDKNSFKANWKIGELYRHHINNTINALAHYEIASKNIERSSSDRILFFREYGRLLLFSQDKGSKEKAQKCFEKALSSGYDSIAINQLATILSDKQQYNLVIELIERNSEKMSPKDKLHNFPLLLKAYTEKGDLLKAAQLRSEIQKLQL